MKTGTVRAAIAAYPSRGFNPGNPNRISSLDHSGRLPDNQLASLARLRSPLITFTGIRNMGGSRTRVLVVDDYEPWRRYVRVALLAQDGLQIVGEGVDGSEAIEKAEELQPDLVLLDIGLPTLNGIEAARRIRKVSPTAKILFVSENRSPEIAQAALGTGAGGYVVKSDAASELLAAVKAVLKGKQFISASLAGHFLVAATLATTTQAISWVVTLVSGMS
jgi:DNA-binding NarL/FixJ family response regulator